MTTVYAPVVEITPAEYKRATEVTYLGYVYGAMAAQFNWGRNKLPMRPQPVPPIFQPEVAADAIVFASTAERREVWVGSSSFKAILANKIAPGFLDHYLARFGYESQMSSEPALKDAPDNLFRTIEGDFGAHGRFDREALASTDIRSPVLSGLAITGGTLVGLLFLVLRLKGRQPKRRRLARLEPRALWNR